MRYIRIEVLFISYELRMCDQISEITTEWFKLIALLTLIVSGTDFEADLMNPLARLAGAHC